MQDSEELALEDPEIAAAAAALRQSQIAVSLKPIVRMHSINPDKAVVAAASASDRKTFTCESSTDFMTKSIHAPPAIKSNAVFAVNATTRGIRECLLKHRKCSAGYN